MRPARSSFTFAVAACALLAACAREPALPPPPPRPPLEFLGEWGIRGDGPGHLLDPAGIAVDSVGNIYLADAGNRFVHKFSPTGAPRLSFQSSGLAEPGCIALDRGDAIYVCDGKRNAVSIFLPDGKLFRVLRGSGAGGKLLPYGIAVDADGNIFVAAGIRVVKFNSGGRFERAWGTKGGNPGDFLNASGIQVASDGSLFVLDRENVRVQRFSPQGVYLGEWSTHVRKNPDEAAEVPDAFTLSGNHVVIAQNARPTLEVWTLEGHRRHTFSLATRLRVGEAIQALASSPKGELLVLVRSAERPRVLRLRINF